MSTKSVQRYRTHHDPHLRLSHNSHATDHILNLVLEIHHGRIHSDQPSKTTSKNLAVQPPIVGMLR